MVFANDETILTNSDQPDHWSVTHVLLPWFFMLWGFPWYVPLLGVYFLKAIEALPFLDYATTTDALIVDPLQAIMGILAFGVLHEFGLSTVSFPLPLRKHKFKEWVLTGYSWLPTIILITVLELTDSFHLDWIYVFTFSGQAVHTAYHQDTNAQKIAVFTYPVVLSVLLASVNQIPYSAWFVSVYVHAPLLIPVLVIARRKWYVWSPPTSSKAIISENERLVVSSLKI